MDFAYLFTSFDGRIARKPFWVALLIMIAAAIVISIVAAFAVGLESRSFKIIGLVLDIVLLYPFLAVFAKRLHDRNRPNYFAYIMVAPWLLTAICTALDIVGNPERLNALDYILSAASLAFTVWIVVDLGILRGTVGPNEYGPDPLEMQIPLRA